jgi:hypothetical protein
MGNVDIENAQATFANLLKTSDSVALSQSEVDQVNQLLREYGSQREELQKKMVSLLAQYDPSSLDRDWVDYCGKGKDLLGNLNSKMPSQGGGGLAGAGMGDFYRGEMSIWTENARAEIALRAKEMKTIHLANLKLLQECNEDLKKVLSDEQDVQKYVEGTLGAMLDVLKKTATFLYAIVQIERYKGQPSIPDQIKVLGDQLKDSYARAADAANKKQALLKILLARINLLKELKSKLNKDAIKAASDTGRTTAEKLYVAGKSSPYEARDWEEFGKECKDKLQEECDRSVTDADALFDMLYNRLDEETQKSFEALSNNPSQWESWDNEIGKSFESIQSALDNVEKYTETLAESKIKEGLKAALDTSKVMVKTYIDDWKKTLSDIKDKLRRN